MEEIETNYTQRQFTINFNLSFYRKKEYILSLSLMEIFYSHTIGDVYHQVSSSI